MPAIKRRINSTGRRRIPRERADIRIEPPKAGEPLRASATLKVDDLNFPPDALLILEAYQRSSGMRFACGTVGNVKVPPVLHLNDIDRNGSILFRVKVVDADGANGKILGSADRIRPAGEEDLEGRRSIFPISEEDLGREVWRVDVDDDGPRLLLNFRIVGFKHRILENPLLRGIILPAAFRIVLENLAADPVPDDDEEDDWRLLWLRYLKESFGIDDDVALLDDEGRKKWIEETVRIFCEAHDFVDAIRTMNDGSA
jgi:hypothetical protein